MGTRIATNAMENLLHNLFALMFLVIFCMRKTGQVIRFVHLSLLLQPA